VGQHPTRILVVSHWREPWLVYFGGYLILRWAGSEQSSLAIPVALNQEHFCLPKCLMDFNGQQSL